MTDLSFFLYFCYFKKKKSMIHRLAGLQTCDTAACFCRWLLYFPRTSAVNTVLLCVFCLESLEPRPVTLTWSPLDDRRCLSSRDCQTRGGGGGSSVLTWKLWVYETWSDPGCKTNRALPSFVSWSPAGSFPCTLLTFNWSKIISV